MRRLQNTLLLLLALASVTVFGDNGLTALQLTPISASVGIKCSRLFFKSPQNYTGSIFVLPRVAAGTGDEEKPIYDVFPNDTPGHYTLKLFLYFPFNDEVLTASGGSQRREDEDACDTDAVLQSINARLSNTNEQVKEVLPLPLTSLDVKLAGINQMGRLGDIPPRDDKGEVKSVDVIQYYGQYVTVSFDLTEAQLDLFESQVRSDAGIVASIFPHFEVKLPDGSVVAKVDTSSLQTGLEGLAHGQKVIASADLHAFLQKNVNGQTVSIVSEEGKSGSAPAVTQAVIDKVLATIQTALTNPTPSKDCEGSPSSTMISVCAAVSAISNASNTQIAIQQVGAPESTSALKQVVFRTRSLVDRNRRYFPVDAAYTAPSVGFNLRKGQTITISFFRESVHEIDYRETTKYLQLSDIKALKLGESDEFGDQISNPNFKIVNKDVNGISFAEGMPKVTLPVALWGGYKYYRWKRTFKYPKRTPIFTQRIDRTEDAIERLPVLISFSWDPAYFMKIINLVRYGNNDQNPLWSAHFDADKNIVLTAKADLGVLSFDEQMQPTPNNQKSTDTNVMATADLYEEPMDLDVVEEVELDSAHNPLPKKNPARKVLRTDKDAVTLQRTYTFVVSSPRTATPEDLKTSLPQSVPPALKTTVEVPREGSNTTNPVAAMAAAPPSASKGRNHLPIEESPAFVPYGIAPVSPSYSGIPPAEPDRKN